MWSFWRIFSIPAGRCPTSAICCASAAPLPYRYLLSKEPASLKICTFLDKPAGRTVDMNADYVAFTIPNAFVVGYGLDYDDYYRNLPYVGVLKPSVYED